jgi:hypothetical protein
MALIDPQDCSTKGSVFSIIFLSMVGAVYRTIRIASISWLAMFPTSLLSSDASLNVPGMKVRATSFLCRVLIAGRVDSGGIFDELVPRRLGSNRYREVVFDGDPVRGAAQSLQLSEQAIFSDSTEFPEVEVVREDLAKDT